MVISCAAVNCTNRQGKVDKNEVSFHRFPIKNARCLAKWKRAVRRENWMPNKYSFLCSRHFTPDCFLQRCEDQHRQLKAGAVPSIFDFSPKDKGTKGNVRKKMLSLQVPDDEHEGEGEENEALPSCKRPIQSKRGLLKGVSCMSMSLKNGHARAVNSETENNLVGPSNLLPQPPVHQNVGEWSVNGEEEVFKPSACNLIVALHSYSSTSRLERHGQSHWDNAPGRVGAEEAPLLSLLTKPGQRFPLASKMTRSRWRRCLTRQQLQKRAKCFRTILQIRRFRRHLELTTGEVIVG